MKGVHVAFVDVSGFAKLKPSCDAFKFGGCVKEVDFSGAEVADGHFKWSEMAWKMCRYVSRRISKIDL